MSPDEQLDTSRELALVCDWNAQNCRERCSLQYLAEALSPASLADEDVKQHLLARLRALEHEQHLWQSLAVAGWCRRYWQAIGKETERRL